MAGKRVEGPRRAVAAASLGVSAAAPPSARISMPLDRRGVVGRVWRPAKRC